MDTLEDSHLAQTYQKLPVDVVRGDGALLWDAQGREYIDCMGGYGVAVVGHCNPRVVRAVKTQVERLITCHGSIYNGVRAEFLSKLVSISPRNLTKAYLCNSGAEAIEAALKLARKSTGREEIVSMSGSYHGKTLGALSATWDSKYKEPFKPLVPGIRFTNYGDIDRARESISSNTAAIIAEPIQGESGIHVPPPEFLKGLRDICNERKVLLILDEIQSGFGRTGKVWACENWGVEPDIMCIGKGIGGGLPLACAMASSEIMGAFKIGEHTSTFGGNPLSCAAGSAAIDSLIQDGLVERASEVGTFLKKRLEELKDRHKIVRDVRGLGLMLGMELRFEVKKIILDALKEGIILLYSGKNIIRFLPPLVITKEQVENVLVVLDKLLSEEERLRGLP